MAKCKELQLYYDIREMSSRPSRNSIYKHTRILQLQSRKTHMYPIAFSNKIQSHSNNKYIYVEKNISSSYMTVTYCLRDFALIQNRILVKLHFFFVVNLITWNILSYFYKYIPLEILYIYARISLYSCTRKFCIYLHKRFEYLHYFIAISMEFFHQEFDLLVPIT